MAETRTINLTHRGWFGICPVYLGDMDSDAPLVLERHRLLTPLMMLSEAVYALCFVCVEAMGGEPPGWPLRITGSLPPGRVFRVPAEAIEP